MYAEDMTGGVIVASKFLKLAGKRFLTRLERTDISFDTAAAQQVFDYMARLGLELLSWQVFVLANLFGFKLAAGLRRFRYAFIIVAKKNGKTALPAALSRYMMVLIPHPHGSFEAQALRLVSGRRGDVDASVGFGVTEWIGQISTRQVETVAAEARLIQTFS